MRTINMNYYDKNIYAIRNRYVYYTRRRKSKADWAGISPHNGFQFNVESSTILQGQRKFYIETGKALAVVKRLADAKSTKISYTKPQLGPAYTDYPVILSTYACIGLTAHLTFKEYLKEEVLSVYLSNYLENPSAFDNVNVDPIHYKRVVQSIVKIVEDRLILESLRREPSLSCVEYYRLFCASQKNGFDSLIDIIEVVVLYGDVFILPSEKLHPITELILNELMEVSQSYLKRLSTAEPSEFMEIGVAWVKTLSKASAKYLPPPNNKETSGKGAGNKESHQASLNSSHIFSDQRFEPLNQPSPPMIEKPSNFLEQIANSISSKNSMIQNILASFEESIYKLDDIVADIALTLELAVKGNSSSGWKDMRSDLVELNLSLNPFDQSPIQGMPESGYEITANLNGKDCTEELFDRPIPVPASLGAKELRELDMLRINSQPIIDSLKRTLYINIQNNPITERFVSSGSLDGNRLAVGNFSDAIFKRYKIIQESDQRGNPLLLIACDGSGSLNYDQMQMLKVLTFSWLEATSKTGIKVMAGLYHSGYVNNGRSGPLIQWLYHPLKTPAITRREASSGLVLLPNSGTGAQSDALSLKFMFEEASKLARGNMVYMILLTDTVWNKSFKDVNMTPEEEVHSVLSQAYDDFNDKLHITLVALGVSDQKVIGMVEELVDYTIKVPSDQLKNYSLVADRISTYVAKCMKERNLLLQKGK